MEKLFNLYLQNLETSEKLIDVIIPVIKTFEGKVYNKRFRNKVDESLLRYFDNDVCRTVYFCPEIDGNRIAFYFKFVNSGSVKGPSCWSYLPDSYKKVEILRDYRNSSEDMLKYISYDENYNIRLNASLIVRKLTGEKEAIKKRIELLKAEAAKVDGYKKRLEDLKKEIEELDEKIPYEIKDFFQIKSYPDWH